MIRLPAPLLHCAAGRAEIEARGATVGAALASAVAEYPALRRHLYREDGELRGDVNIYLNDEDIRHLAGEATAVRAGDELQVVPSIAGGSGAGGSGVGDALHPSGLTEAEVVRYSRNIAVPEVGWEGQKKLRSARILLVGAGGLGAPLGLYLAAAGVGTIGVVEFDEVDLSNLQRQVLYGVDDVGRPKLEVARERLRAINPHIEVVAHPVRLTSENALEILAQYDIVVDGTDNFPTRYLVNDACVLLGKPYVYGSILRFDGQVSVFGAPGGPCYRCLFREPPPPGLVPSCAEGGVLGVLPGIIGTHQALEALKLIIGVGEPLIGRILLLDGLSMRWRELKLRKNSDCPACGERPTITHLIDYEEFCGMKTPTTTDANTVPELTPTELKARLDRGDRLEIIDVREPFEWEIANLGPQGARLIPLGALEERLTELDPEAEIVLQCRSGGRSERALRQLRAAGFERLWNLKGGILAWSDEVDPTIQKY
jgi:adenylyltransferase/sulfurtransferase